ncbi:unnamed protein product [Periconia digitata]|uniref:Uncharacterized protein n=1 Tax=Periconia digitata TaxID=1303443 RepID=A0A9W4XLG7_9PLEO|nr:unnamed protein product [Periconia digitata]
MVNLLGNLARRMQISDPALLLAESCYLLSGPPILLIADQARPLPAIRFCLTILLE